MPSTCVLVLYSLCADSFIKYVNVPHSKHVLIRIATFELLVYSAFQSTLFKNLPFSSHSKALSYLVEPPNWATRLEWAFSSE